DKTEKKQTLYYPNRCRTSCHPTVFIDPTFLWRCVTICLLGSSIFAFHFTHWPYLRQHEVAGPYLSISKEVFSILLYSIYLLYLNYCGSATSRNLATYCRGLCKNGRQRSRR